MTGWGACAVGGLVTALTAFLYIRPRLINRDFGVDSWRHLDEADALRRCRRWPRGAPERYLIDKPSDYPPLLRIILALVPKPVLERWEWLVSPLFSAAHQLLLFNVVWTWTHRVDLAVIAQLVYGVTPLVIMENSNLTTRSFAALLFTLGWLPLTAYQVTGQAGWLGVSIVMFGLLFLAHRLALQALLALSLAWSVWDRTWVPLGIFIAAVLTAAVLSGGFYWKVLRGQVTMLNYWRINIANRFAHQIRGLPKPGATDPDRVFQLYQVIQRAPFTALIVSNPFAVFLVPWFLHPVWLRQPAFGIPAGYLPQFLFWATALWVIGLIIRQWPPVRFLGEGERYLEYAAFPIAALTAVLVGRGLAGPSAGWWVGAFAAVLLAGNVIPGLILQRQLIIEQAERSVTPTLQAIFDRLNQSSSEIRLVTIPLYLSSATVHFTQPHVKALTTDSSYAHLTDLTDILPVLKVPLKELARRYRLTHVLLSERYVTLAELGLQESEVMHRSGIFCIARVG